jgi:hypothetical protein
MQVEQLKQILAKEDITMSQNTIERAFKHPHFDWNDSLMDGKIEYPTPGVGLFHNPFPKEKKKKAKKGRAASPKKKKEK